MNLNPLAIAVTRFSAGGDYYPALPLDFRTNEAIDSRITFARASNATYFDSSGVLQTAGSGVARANQYQDYNPSTLAPLGFLIEEQRTNSIRNNTMQGAVAGTPGTLPTNWASTVGGLAFNVIGTGTESGITYIDIQFVGTTSATSFNVRFDQNLAVAAVNGQTWTNSFFCRMVNGATTNIGAIKNRITFRDSGGATLTTGDVDFLSTISASSIAVARRQNTFTAANASIAAVVGAVLFECVSGVAIDITLRIGLPQLELGSFATSPILTTAAAATRLADVASITGANFSSFWNATEGTVVVRGDYSYIATGQPGLVRADDGTDNERMMLAITSGTQRFTVVDGGVELADISRTGVIVGTPFAQAAAYKVNDCASVVNGGTAGTDATVSIPTVNTMRFSRAIGADYPNGHIQSLSYYNKRLSNETLQALTV